MKLKDITERIKRKRKIRRILRDYYKLERKNRGCTDVDPDGGFFDDEWRKLP